MQYEYVQSTKYAFAGHAVLMAAAVALSFWQGCLRRPREELVEFTVVLDQGRIDVAPQDKPEPPAPAPKDPEPIREPDPPPPVPPVPITPVDTHEAVVLDKKPDKPPEPKPPEPKPDKPEIKIGPRIVRQTTTAPKPVRATQPRLSATEIERMLKNGATPGVRNTLANDEVSRCMLLIKRALYAAWDPPSRADAGSRPAEVELRFGASGRIMSARISQSSGNADYDRSVTAAVAAVDRVDGLTTAFLQRYDRLTVEFKLEE
jgi:protein TonB